MSGNTGSSAPRTGVGLAWCLGSVLLVSIAQLALKYAVSHLTGLSLQTLLPFPAAQWHGPLALLGGGLFCYAVSMVCWFFALRHLPLNYAYPMLGLSYALVSMLAVVLPWFDEPFTLLQACGVGCVIFGIWLITTTKHSSALPNHRKSE